MNWNLGAKGKAWVTSCCKSLSWCLQERNEFCDASHKMIYCAFAQYVYKPIFFKSLELVSNTKETP